MSELLGYRDSDYTFVDAECVIKEREIHEEDWLETVDGRLEGHDEGIDAIEIDQPNVLRVLVGLCCFFGDLLLL